MVTARKRTDVRDRQHGAPGDRPATARHRGDIGPVISEQIGETSMADAARLRGVMSYVVDPKGAEQLWTLSERLLDLKFL